MEIDKKDTTTPMTKIGKASLICKGKRICGPKQSALILSYVLLLLPSLAYAVVM